MSSVRPASQRDIPALERLLRESFTSSYAHFMPAPFVRDWQMGDEPNRLLRRVLNDTGVAMINNAPAGFVTCKDGFLTELWVAPHMKRRGVGTMLLQWAEERMLDRGHDTVSLSCYARNTAGLTFFRRMGFSITSRFRSRRVAGGPVEVCTMVKPIDGSGGRNRS